MRSDMLLAACVEAKRFLDVLVACSGAVHTCALPNYTVSFLLAGLGAP